jgi:DNA-binding MarR family transcriptional regulator
VPDSGAELLETLLKVMRLAVVHGEAPAGGMAGTALTMAEGVLLVELLAAGEVTQQQIADRLRLDKSRVSRLCSALERKHLLARQRDESNRRNLRVRITASGAAAATRLRRAWHERHERMLAAMTPDERHALLLGLGALVRELTALHHEHQTAQEPLAT